MRTCHVIPGPATLSNFCQQLGLLFFIWWKLSFFEVVKISYLLMLQSDQPKVFPFIDHCGSLTLWMPSLAQREAAWQTEETQVWSVQWVLSCSDISATLGNAVSVAHEITVTCYWIKLTINTPGLMVQQESAYPRGKLSPARVQPSLLGNEACGPLLFILGWQSHAYYITVSSSPLVHFFAPCWK